MTPKSIPAMLLIYGCCSILSAGGIGEDAARGDAPAPAAGAVKTTQLTGSALREKALGNFVRAAMNPKADPKQRLEWLAAALDADPSSQSAMTLFVAILNENPSASPEGCEMFYRVAWNHPGKPVLTLRYFELVTRFGTDPRQIGTLLDHTLEAGEKSGDRNTADDMTLCRLLEIAAALEFQRGEDGSVSTERFRRFLGIDGFKAAEELRKLAARHFLQASKRADRSRRWFGLRQSPRAALMEESDRLLAGIIASDAAVTEPRAQELLAFYYLSVQRPKDAIRVAARLVSQEENSPASRLTLARVYYFARKYRDALLQTQSLLSIAPENQELLQLEGEAALRCGEFSVAENVGRRMLKLNPDDAIGRYLQIAGMTYGGKLDEAAKTVAAFAPGEERDSLEMLISLRRKDYSKTLERLRALEQKLGAKAPDSIFLYMLTVAEKSRDVELLNHAWKKLEAMGALAEYDNANTVGYVAAELNTRLDEAETLIREAVNAEPDNGAYIDSLAWVLYRKGELKKAYETICDALDAPMDTALGRGTLLVHAGEIAEKLGKTAEAKQYYDEALGSFDDPDLDLEDLQKRIRNLEKSK